MNHALNSKEEFEQFLASHKIILTYFSTNECNVCKILKPKVIELIKKEFPLINFLYVNINEFRELAAQLGIFGVPTIIIYAEGKEFIRKSRFINLEELKNEIDRICKLFY